jgi:hypothetical protein
MGIRDSIRNAKDIKEEVIDVPEWGCKVLLISLSGTARDEFERKMDDPTDEDETLHLRNITAKLLCATMYDPETRKLVYDYNKPQDVAELGQRNSDVLRRLFRKAKELSGMLDEDKASLDKKTKK